jgi:NAD(P)-dependent dehydrogenase (short-subunit alcohol dehydrogenase family)
MPTSNEFAGMTALVTGASSGIGAETAVGLARFGASVIVHYNANRAGAEKVASAIRQDGGAASLIAGDLSSPEGIRSVVTQIQSWEKPIDILVNNAGSLLERTSVLDITEEYWGRVLALNLTSAFFVAQAVLPRMVERRRGWIVNVSSLAALVGGGIGASAYATAKGGLSTLTKALAREFAPHGISVNAVSPGTIDTNYHRNFSSTEALESVVRATPMGRLGSSCETASVVLFLCSQEARFIQGQAIEVNGGFSMA